MECFRKSIFDFRVFHAPAPTNASKPIPTSPIPESHEKEKKRCYNARVLQVERGSTFTPLVFSTSGGMGKEASKLVKRLAQHIIWKSLRANAVGYYISRVSSRPQL